MFALKDIIITSALPYANGNIHIGHLRSTYVPADIYARFLRLQGQNVIYICATDENGTPIAIRAEKDGIKPKQIADKYHKSIHEDLIAVGCSFDYFSRTTSLLHHELTQVLFKNLLKRKYIYKAKFEQLFCPQCNRFLPDRYVEGTCPYCGEEKARGDACDACGRYLKPFELKEPNCVSCGSKPDIQSTTHYFFKLSGFDDFLKKWIEKDEEFSSNVKNYVLKWLQQGLRDWCVTRDMNWGIPVPIEEAKGKVIYVWFDAPIGYISTSIEWATQRGKPEEWRNFWQKATGKVVHFIGKDIIYHHAIFWPAILKASGKYRLPYKIIAGEYLTLEGKKMSKSRGWVIEVKQYLEKFEPDPLRYYLIAIAPLNKDADFSWKEFIRKNNDELADILGNFIHRTLQFTYRFFNKQIPQVDKNFRKNNEIHKTIQSTKHKVETALNKQNFHRAIRAIIELSATGNRYLNAEEPWKVLQYEPLKAASTLYLSTQIVKALAILIEPFLPFTAEKIWNLLNLPGNVHEQEWNESLRELSPGHIIKKPIILFKKIEVRH